MFDNDKKQNNPLYEQCDYMPWMFHRLPEEKKLSQLEWHDSLQKHGIISMRDNGFVSRKANLFPDDSKIHSLGENSWIAADCLVRGKVNIGDNSSLNVGVIIIGDVTIGNGVRIASGSQLMGFNHEYSDPEIPFYKTDCTFEGITIEDDVWIGANVIITDGVTVGAHSILAAGTVVTRDVPQYSVIGGVPGKVIRNRRDKVQPVKCNDNIESNLQEFGKKVREQLQDVLSCHFCEYEGEETFFDRSQNRPDIIAWCQAVELSGLFGKIPEQLPRECIIERLKGFQNSETGMFEDPWTPEPQAENYLHGYDGYDILGVGYALEVLGEKPLYPIKAIRDMTVESLFANLERIHTNSNGWHFGANVDSLGTGIYLNAKYFGLKFPVEAFFGWLNTHVKPHNGTWYEPEAYSGGRWLFAVNGFYRLTRGSYAQFGVPLPYPEEAIDTVLAHARNTKYFSTDRGNCCNVLDVAHPLYLAGLQTSHRREEVKQVARFLLERPLKHWTDGVGMSFTLEPGDLPAHRQTVKMTEQWLSTIYLLASIIGIEAALEYCPKGIHRREAVIGVNDVMRSFNL